MDRAGHSWKKVQAARMRRMPCMQHVGRDSEAVSSDRTAI